jgi:hypothetical protein
MCSTDEQRGKKETGKFHGRGALKRHEGSHVTAKHDLHAKPKQPHYRVPSSFSSRAKRAFSM